MKVALVHDYVKEYGGAERVLRVLADMYPQAPIYTAFAVKDSVAVRKFSDRKIIESKLAWLIRPWKLYSPLRFLLPLIWGSIDLSDYDLVITSCSSYIARGFKKGPKTKVVAYCHTPPKFLYGYQTSINWQKYWPVKVYGIIVNHFLRIFDFKSAQEVDCWIANSENVRGRIKKFYKKDAVVIFPPIEVKPMLAASKRAKKKDYFFIAARLVGGKGLEEAVRLMSELKIKLKVAGEQGGWANTQKILERSKDENVELLGRVSEKELASLYAGAKGFLALEKDVDFGMTPVEAMAAGTPVIALDSGGYRETVIEGETGILVRDLQEETIKKAVDKFNKISWGKAKLQRHAKRFSKERFKKEMLKFIEKHARTT
jgi:glycosyltransferase involved in cell wall biosynthesis